jgi:hypothetical protein
MERFGAAKMRANEKRAEAVIAAQSDGLAVFCLRPSLIAWLIREEMKVSGAIDLFQAARLL